MLDKVTKGKIKQPHLVLLMGVDAVGKTTFGASAPKPIIIGPESGSANIDVARIELRTYAEIMKFLDVLRTEKHDYQTVVLDSIDWMEQGVWQAVCESGGVKSIEQFGGGFGKGYLESLTFWSRMMDKLRLLREEKKMNIVIIAHTEIKPFNDPTQPTSYDRFQLKLNAKAAALWREFVDTVLFATYEVFVKKEGLKGRAYGDGARVVYTERRPGFDAKNRFGLPFQLPLSWAAYEEACNAATPGEPGALKDSIKELIKSLSDENLKAKVIEAVEKAGDNSVQLNAIKTRVLVRLQAN